MTLKFQALVVLNLIQVTLNFFVLPHFKHTPHILELLKSKLYLWQCSYTQRKLFVSALIRFVFIIFQWMICWSVMKSILCWSTFAMTFCRLYVNLNILAIWKVACWVLKSFLKCFRNLEVKFITIIRLIIFYPSRWL